MSVRRLGGSWWLAPHDDDSTEVGGVLTITAAGQVLLEVTSALVDRGYGRSRGQRRRSADEPTVIHGAAEGQAVTLLGCTPTNGGTVSLLPLPTEIQVFRAEAALIGCWLNDADQAEFDGMRVEISHLTQWARHSGLSYDIIAERPDSTEHEPFHTVELRSVPTVTVELPGEQATVSLLWAQGFNPGGKDNAWGRQHRVSERTVFEVRSDTPRTAMGFESTVRPLQNLLTAATQSACAVGARHLIPRRADGEDESSRRRDIELYFRGEEIEIKQDLHDHELLFTLADINLATALPRWYELRNMIGGAVDVLFGLDYAAGGYYETALFSAATAAEGIHSALVPATTAIDPEQHRTVKKLIRQALKSDATIDDVTRQWASNKLGYNSPGLNQRLRELAQLPDPEAVQALLGDPEVWARWLTIARNAIGHGRSGAAQAKSAPEEAHYRLADITKYLLHLVLLSQMGLSAHLQRLAVHQIWGYQARRFRALIEESKPIPPQQA
ncbi:HEPN domain-containing protein [Nocardia jejuensis]|uniref:ApeA N-terminal domain 1-containing protein n=1 Tax=Nocardia jejuensis TaxID=328049 RepID=UPI00082C8C7A|nr:HEPN domain-containing protein [Nocardia jejuensis]